MDKTETYIFNRCYQSYLNGGDTYSFHYKTEDNEKIDSFKGAIKNLEDNGLVSVLFQSNKKTRMSLTDKGIDYANSTSHH